MTLPASGTIALSQIKTEFAVSGTFTLRQFLRGAGIVPNHASFAAIPTSGTIKVTDFYGISFTPPAALSPSTDTISLVYPTLSGVSANMTCTFSGGGSRTLSFTNGSGGTVTWRKNGGSYTSGTLSVATGDYINFRYASGGDDSGLVDIFDDTAYGINIGQVSVSKTGSP